MSQLSNGDPYRTASQVPRWVEVTLYIVQRVPFSEIVAIGLFLVFIGVLPSPWTTATERVREVMVSLEAHRREEQDLRKLFSDLLEAVKINSGVQRRICRNVASNPIDKLACGD